MLTKETQIINKLGLHARASAKLTQLAGKFKCEVWMSQGNAPHQRQEHHGRDDAGGRQGFDGEH
jgi:phosphotransferase system HPr (HPr) family protein